VRSAGRDATLPPVAAGIGHAISMISCLRRIGQTGAYRVRRMNGAEVVALDG
jgi:hypothetical protein